MAKKGITITDSMFADFSPKKFERKKPQGFSSGSYMLNIIWTGHYDVGYVYGKLYTIAGLEGSGKTTIGLHGLAEAQKAKHDALYEDMEHAFARIYAQGIGIDLKRPRLWFAQPGSGEEMFKMARYAIQEKGCRFWLLDSIEASKPQCMIDASEEDSTVAALARLFGANTFKFIKMIEEYKVAALWINQIRMKVGVVLGSPEVEPGGNSFRFYATVRNQIRANLGDRIKDSQSLNYANNAVLKEHEGVFFSVKTIKNRQNDPFQTVKLAIKYGEGLDRKVDIVQFGRYMGIVDGVTDKQFKYAPLKKKVAPKKARKTLGRKPVKKKKAVAPSVTKTVQYNFSNVSDGIINEIEERAKKLFDSGHRPNIILTDE